MGSEMKNSGSGRLQDMLSLRNAWFFCFVLLLSIRVVWVILIDIPPLQDYPIHLAQSFIVANSQMYTDIYSVKVFPHPYILQDIILHFFLVLGYSAAGKVLLIAALLIIPLGVLFLLRTLNPGREYLSLLVLPLCWNKLFFKGNLNFLLGIGVLLFTLALSWSAIHGRSKRGFLYLGVLAITLFFSHLIAYILFLVLAIPLLVYLLIGRRVGRCVLFISALSPSILFWIAGSLLRPPSFVEDTERLNLGKILGSIMDPMFLQSKIIDIRSLLVSFTQDEWYIFFPVLALGSFLLLGGILELRRRWFAFAMIFILISLYIMVPTHLQILIRPHERILYVVLFIAPTCMGFPERFGGGRIISLAEQMVGVVLVAVLTTARIDSSIFRQTQRLSQNLSDGLAVIRELPPRRSFLPIFAQHATEGQIAYPRHIGCYYAIEKQGLIAETFTFQLMMVKYVDEPPRRLRMEAVEPEIARHYDILFVWGDGTQIRNELDAIGFTPFKSRSFITAYINSNTAADLLTK